MTKTRRKQQQQQQQPNAPPANGIAPPAQAPTAAATSNSQYGMLGSQPSASPVRGANYGAAATGGGAAKVTDAQRARAAAPAVGAATRPIIPQPRMGLEQQQAAAVAALGIPQPTRPFTQEDLAVCELILQLRNKETREAAVHELSKVRERVPDLACYLWYSFSTVAALLQEITALYPLLNPVNVTTSQSHLVCSCLALLQCIASHPEVKRLFLRAHIPLYLYPFLNAGGNSRALDFLRVTALGVIGALVKGDDVEILRFLLQSEIIPLCLKIMETGTELSQIVATFILHKILAQDDGLVYLCHTAERFYAVSAGLNSMLSQMNPDPPPSPRLLRHIVRCYVRLCDNPKALDYFLHSPPAFLKNKAVLEVAQNDPTAARWLSQLTQLLKLDPLPVSGAPGMQQQPPPPQQPQNYAAQMQQRPPQQAVHMLNEQSNNAISPPGIE